MTRKSIAGAGCIAPAEGLYPTLQARSRARRETQKRLSELGEPLSPSNGRNDLVPELCIEYLLIDNLKPAARRVRKVDAIQSARLDRSIAQFGICQPVLVDRDCRIIHGHGVWEAAKRAGLDRVPVIAVGHLSPAKQRVLAIALNRLGETGTWDVEVLTAELEELVELNEDVLVSGFELAEIDALLLEDETPGFSAEVLPTLPVTSVSQPDDLWRLGDHRLLQGDALEGVNYRRLFEEGETARIALTDEPFNVRVVGHVTGNSHHREFAAASGEMTSEEFATFNRAWMALVVGVLAEGGLLATFIDWRSVELVLASGRELGLHLLNLIVWAKTNGGQGSLWRSQHELLPVFKKGTAAHVNNIRLGTLGRWRSNVWTYAGGSSLGSEARTRSNDHPTVKPRLMLEDALLDVTNRDDIVLDPFLGSGSTLLAAETTGRRCRAIEIDGRYCDVAIGRWQASTGLSAELVETGETFTQVADRRARGDEMSESSDGR